MPEQDPHGPNIAAPMTLPIVERRGLDAAVIALIKQLHEDFVGTHTETHDTFVSAHTREHELSAGSHERALQISHEKLHNEIKHIHNLLTERDRRYQERFEASQTAITAAFDAREKALVEAFDAREKALAAALDAKDKATQAAFDSAEKAIAKAELSIEKRADATYVSLTELQKNLSQLMPRTEAEQRFNSVGTQLSDVRDRVKGIESLKVGTKEAFTNVQMFLGIVVTILAIAGVIIGTR